VTNTEALEEKGCSSGSAPVGGLRFLDRQEVTVHRLRSAVLAVAFATAVTGVLPSTASAAARRATDAPQKIVSLSPTATEMLFAIGAGKQVIAVDDQSTFPERAPRTDLSGYTPNVEAIAGYDPDLVVVSDGQVRKQLEGLGIDVLVLRAADELADSYAQIRKLGKVTGHTKSAERLVAEMKADIADLVERVPNGKRPSAYYEVDDTYFSADSSTFIGRLLKLGGFANVADATKGENGGYPQLSSEFIVDSDPDVVFLADTKCCAQSPETFSERPGFAELTAVADGNVVALDEDVAQRWGPRVVDLLRQIVKQREQQ
jgi:iron complex transport system substrate-binding protein